MRINQFVAAASGLSRRAADQAIADGRITVNGQPAELGQNVAETEHVTLDGQILKLPEATLTIIMNKPVGYVCSRDGQGSKTIYDLLPAEFKNLKPVGRLDKESSGLLLLTSNGQLAHELTHPKFAKEKVYGVELNKPLAQADKAKIEQGVELEDGLSKLQLTTNYKLPTNNYRVAMHEGRNRQIRRTFEALGYKVTKLHRTQFGSYVLDGLKDSEFEKVRQ